MSITESYFGYIETTRDALLVFEACKRGIIPRITRRLQEKDRHLIKSGSIFCFDERESGIKRWTDGLIWSPSRILGNFLVYRELQDKKMVRSNSTDVVFDSPRAISMIRSNSTSLDMNDHEYTPSFGGETGNRRQREKYLIGSLKSSYKFKRNGLVKKSMSLVVDGVQQHLISYYNKDDVLANRLLTPSSMAEFSSLRVPTGLKLRQNFKAPFLRDEGSDDGLVVKLNVYNTYSKF
jgi:hypothetical protein